MLAADTKKDRGNAAGVRTLSLAAVDLTAYQRDGVLIDACGIPNLNGREVGLPRLLVAAGAPASAQHRRLAWRWRDYPRKTLAGAETSR
jgi:hypothetical protein